MAAILMDNDVTDLFTVEGLTELFRYLDDLRASGIVNMYGADNYIVEDLDLSRDQARVGLLAWMETYSDLIYPENRVKDLFD